MGNVDQLIEHFKSRVAETRRILELEKRSPYEAGVETGKAAEALAALQAVERLKEIIEALKISGGMI